MLDMFNLFDE
jgi:hypothetical protein